MPNTFAPRAFSDVVKDRAELLRGKHDGPDHELKEWHAMVDLLGDDATADFVARYGKPEEIPSVVSLPDGVE